MSDQLPYNSQTATPPAEQPDPTADEHLKHLLPPPEKGTLSSLIESIRELIHPPKLPPLEVTSKPVEMEKGKGQYAGNEWKAGLMSLLINGSILGILLLLGTNEKVQEAVKETTKLVFTPVKPVSEPPKPPPLPPKAQTAQGGGGQPDKLPESKGKAPPVAPKQFVRPTNTTIENPKLTIDPTVIGAIDLPKIDSPNYGNPLSGVTGPPSLGGGVGTGLGSGKGGGVGAGEGGGFGGGVYRIGGGVSAPSVISKVEPEYSEEARKAKYTGKVWLSVVVDENGVPRDIKVTRKLGLGLDEKAVEAVAKWRFKPGMKDGKPVAVQATIEVSFSIL